MEVNDIPWPVLLNLPLRGVALAEGRINANELGATLVLGAPRLQGSCSIGLLVGIHGEAVVLVAHRDIGDGSELPWARPHRDRRAAPTALRQRRVPPAAVVPGASLASRGRSRGTETHKHTPARGNLWRPAQSCVVRPERVATRRAEATDGRHPVGSRAVASVSGTGAGLLLSRSATKAISYASWAKASFLFLSFLLPTVQVG